MSNNIVLLHTRYARKLISQTHHPYIACATLTFNTSQELQTYIDVHTRCWSPKIATVAKINACMLDLAFPPIAKNTLQLWRAQQTPHPEFGEYCFVHNI